MASLWSIVFLKRREGNIFHLKVKQHDCNINSMINTELDHQAFQWPLGKQVSCGCSQMAKNETDPQAALKSISGQAILTFFSLSPAQTETGRELCPIITKHSMLLETFHLKTLPFPPSNMNCYGPTILQLSVDDVSSLRVNEQREVSWLRSHRDQNVLADLSSRPLPLGLSTCIS